MQPPERSIGRDRAAVAHFRSAIAQWRLSLHTECKRASSLPTAMFGAADPMLEARLAEAAETMLLRLQEPPPELASDDATGEQRLEEVTTEELRPLARRLANGPSAPPDLEPGLAAEYLAILGDACATGEPSVRAAAHQRLRSEFGVASALDIDTLADLLKAQLTAAEGDDNVVDDLAATSRRLAAAALTTNQAPRVPGETPPR
jgi:hypothetical protein